LLPTGIRDLHYKMSTVEGPPAAARTSARHALARRLRWPSAANVVALAQRLAREPLDGRRRALRDIAAALAEQGHVTVNLKPYAHTAVAID